MKKAFSFSRTYRDNPNFTTTKPRKHHTKNPSFFYVLSKARREIGAGQRVTALPGVGDP